MDVVSAAPLRASSIFWQGTTRVLTVVCKVTFALVPGESTLAADPEGIHEHDVHEGDDPAKSIVAPSDLVPFKGRADVLLVGSAFAQCGEPTRSLVVRMIIGELDKAIEVHQDRAWSHEGALHEGARFTSMPLGYERAAGGPDTPNPLGVRADARPSTYGMVALPNLQPPGLQISGRGDTIPPVGFGPIGPTWASRREKLGRHAATWNAQSWNQTPLPRDIEPAYFNSAPRDQQIDELRVDERIILENLHPEVPRLVTRLPGMRPRAFVDVGSRSLQQEIALLCETLWIDTTRSICTLTFRGHLENPPPVGRVIIGLEHPGQRLTFADVEQQIRVEPESPPVRARKPKPDDDGAPLFPRRPMTITMSTEALPNGPQQATALPFAGAPPTSNAPATGERPSLSASMSGVFAAPSATPFSAPASIPPMTSGTPFSAPASIPPMTSGTPFSAPASIPPMASVAAFSAPAQVAPPTTTSSPGLSESRWAASPPLAANSPAPPIVGLGFRGAAGEPPRVPEVIPAPQSSSPWGTTDSRAGAPPPLTVGQSTAQPMPASAPTAPSAPIVAATPAPAQSWAGKTLQLVWFDPECLPSVHRKPAFQPILRALEKRAVDPELDDPTRARDPATIEDRRDIFEVIARGSALDEPALNQALERGARDDGKLVPPLVLLDGEVRMFFDEIEMLRATLTIAAVFSSGDDALKTAIADAREFLRTPDLRSPPSVTEGYITRVQEAMKRAKRATTPGYLDEQTERVLVEARQYQRRTVYGAPHLRAQIQIGNATRPWPLYIPEAAANRLPMFARFTARILAEAGVQENQYEAHPGSLRAAAIARVAPTPGKPERDAKS